jgi:hypothetical protein
MVASSKFERSWTIAKLCLSVLSRNKSLLAFPIVTFVFSIFVIGLFVAPLALTPTGHSVLDPQHWEQIGAKFFSSETTHDGSSARVSFQISGWVYWSLLYLGSMFVVTYSNVAFYHEILSALRGGDVSLSRGLSFAATKWKSILLWTLFAGAVGIIIKAIEEKVSFVARLIVGLIGAAWSVASIFVIPILVENDSPNPIDALKKSALMLRQTWGEAIFGYAGLVLGNLIIFVLTVVIVLGSIFFGAAQDVVLLPVLVCAAWFLIVFTYGYTMGVASQVYRGALYLFASQQIVVTGFTPELFQNAWKVKKKR